MPAASGTARGLSGPRNDGRRRWRLGVRGAGVVLVLLLWLPLRAVVAEPPSQLRPLPPIDAAAPVPSGAGRYDDPARGIPRLPEGMPNLMPNLTAPEGRREPLYSLASDPSEYRLPETVLPPAAPHLVEYKNGFFQKVSLTGTAILKDGSDGLGILETELFVACAVPAPSTESPLVIIPTVEMHFLDGPRYADLPAHLYATYLDVVWMPQVTERLKGIVSLAPGWYSDFDGPDAAWFRLTGRGIVRYDWVPDRLQLMLGVLYLGRLHREITPVAGIIWRPDDDWNCELVFPKSKLARRLGCGPGFENWLYLAGGFGGNDWSIHRPDDSRERLSMLDWRLMAGWEHKRDAGAGLWFEAGYVFEREFELGSTGARYEPGATILLRAGASY